MKTRHKRLWAIITGLACLGLAVGLVLRAFNSNLVFFYSPTEVIEGAAPRHGTFRLGGMVRVGTVSHSPGTHAVEFVLTDYAHDIKVFYEGILPDLFGENQGAVVEGSFGDDQRFVAERVLAKHDENYMPPEVAASLKAKPKPGANGPATATKQTPYP